MLWNEFYGILLHLTLQKGLSKTRLSRCWMPRLCFHFVSHLARLGSFRRHIGGMSRNVFFFLFFDLRSTDSPTCFLPFAQKRIRTWSKQSYESYLVPFLPALRKALTHSFKQTGRFKHEESCLRFICFDVVSVSSRVVFKVYLQLFPGISGTHLRNLFDSGLDFPSGTNMKLKRLNPYWGL